MKFQKLSLDESLFDDAPEMSLMYDDEFVGTDLPQEMFEGPRSGSDAGVTEIILDAIHDELEAISTYNSIIETLKFESASNTDYESFIHIIQDISAEENKHVGQLQEILGRLSPNAKMIDVGRKEGEQQFNLTNGRLQVQSWEPKSVTTNSCTSNECNDTCTLIDIDDDM